MSPGIVIVTYECRDFAMRCLESIRRHMPAALPNVVIVDNASTDGTAGAVRKGFPGVKVIEKHRNVGFAAAGNAGIRALPDCDVIVLLNPDSVLLDAGLNAAAEYLHARVRKEWYAPDEALAHDAILAETYRGIRPAFGYPACPDHAPKATLFALLDNASHHTVTLTESYAMHPTASVSGLYFAHPQSSYFSVGRH